MSYFKNKSLNIAKKGHHTIMSFSSYNNWDSIEAAEEYKVPYLKLDLTDEQFELIKKYIREAEETLAINFDKTISPFNISESQIIEFIDCVPPRSSTAHFHPVYSILTIMNGYENKMNIETLLKISKKIKDFAVLFSTQENFLGAEVLENIFHSLFSKFQNKREKDTLLEDMYVFTDSFFDGIDDVINTNLQFDNTLTDRQKKKAILSFKRKCMKTILRCIDYRNLYPKFEFIDKYSEYIPAEYLIDYANEFNQEIQINEKINELLIRRIQRSIFDEFGSCVKCMEIEIKYDFDTVKLFSKLNDDDEVKEDEYF